MVQTEWMQKGEVKGLIDMDAPYPSFGPLDAPVHAEVFFHSLSSRSKKRLLRYIDLSASYPNQIRLEIRPVGRNPDIFKPFFEAMNQNQLLDFLNDTFEDNAPKTSKTQKNPFAKTVTQSNRRITELGHSHTSAAFFNGRKLLIREESQYRLHQTFKAHLHKVNVALAQGIPKNLLGFHFNQRAFDWDQQKIIPRQASFRQALQTDTHDFNTLEIGPSPKQDLASLSKTSPNSEFDTHIYLSLIHI